MVVVGCTLREKRQEGWVQFELVILVRLFKVNLDSELKYLSWFVNEKKNNLETEIYPLTEKIFEAMY